jgi:hypothetical protein
MNRQRILSVLWALEFIVGLIPAVVMLGMGFVSYAVVLQVVPRLLHSGESAALRTFLLATGTIVGGILGIIGILMAYRPERLRQNAGRKRIAIMFACAGLGAELLYLSNGGLGDVSSHFLAGWVMLGPMIVGGHCAYRVFGRASGNASDPVASPKLPL